jgi:hypothetical protein
LYNDPQILKCLNDQNQLIGNIMGSMNKGNNKNNRQRQVEMMKGLEAKFQETQMQTNLQDDLQKLNDKIGQTKINATIEKMGQMHLMKSQMADLGQVMNFYKTSPNFDQYAKLMALRQNQSNQSQNPNEQGSNPQPRPPINSYRQNPQNHQNPQNFQQPKKDNMDKDEIEKLAEKIANKQIKKLEEQEERDRMHQDYEDRLANQSHNKKGNTGGDDSSIDSYEEEMLLRGRKQGYAQPEVKNDMFGGQNPMMAMMMMNMMRGGMGGGGGGDDSSSDSDDEEFMMEKMRMQMQHRNYMMSQHQMMSQNPQANPQAAPGRAQKGILKKKGKGESGGFGEMNVPPIRHIYLPNPRLPEYEYDNYNPAPRFTGPEDFESLGPDQIHNIKKPPDSEQPPNKFHEQYPPNKSPSNKDNPFDKKKGPQRQVPNKSKKPASLSKMGEALRLFRRVATFVWFTIRWKRYMEKKVQDKHKLLTEYYEDDMRAINDQVFLMVRNRTLGFLEGMLTNSLLDIDI